jgi:hypothetical protein
MRLVCPLRDDALVGTKVEPGFRIAIAHGGGEERNRIRWGISALPRQTSVPLVEI